MSQVARWIYPNERSGVHVSGPGRMKGKVIEETRKPERDFRGVCKCNQAFGVFFFFKASSEEWQARKPCVKSAV